MIADPAESPRSLTATCHRRPASDYPSLLSDESERFIDVVYGAGADLPIPACPGWTAADIGEHVGQLYRWAAEHIRQKSQTRIPASTIEMHMPEDRSGQGDWMREGLQILIDALTSTEPETPLWAWGPDRSARFWGRRMLFETTIHRADVELALDRDPAIEDATAMDGIDEFLDNLPHATYFAPKVENLRGEGKLLMNPTDTDVEWLIELLPDGFAWSHHDDGAADATLSGSASDLLLFVYGRLPVAAFAVEGDNELIDFWSANSGI